MSFELLMYVTTCFLFQNVHCSTYAVALLGCHLYHGNITNTGSSQYEFVVINTDTQAIEVNVTSVSTTLQRFSIPANSEKHFIPDGTFALNGSEYANKSIIVASRSNFTLYVFSTSATYSEGFFAIPLEELLGPHNSYDVYEYVVTSFCAPAGYCQLAVSAFQNATVKFTFPGRASDIVFCIGMKYFRSNRDRILKMVAYDVVQMESSHDLSGTHIYSFSPIAVFVGARNLTNGNEVVHLMEQLSTASQWDRDFIVSPLGESAYGDIIKIATSTWNNTLVEISGYGRFLLSNVEVLTRRIYPNTFATITSDNPIQVMQIAGFEDNTDDNIIGTDPHLSLTLVQGSRQAVNFSQISCGSQQKSLKLVVITGRTNAIPLLNGIRMLVANEMGVSDYRIFTHHGRGLIINELRGEIMTGLVQCENGGAFPLGNKHTLPEKEMEQDNYTDGTCIEGETFEYIEDTYGNSDQIIKERSFEGFSVLKLRVKFCGAVILQFKMKAGSVIIRLTSLLNTATICVDDVCDLTYTMESDFNVMRACETDMAWYWIRQNMVNGSFFLDIGTGPIMFEPLKNLNGYQVYEYSVLRMHYPDTVDVIPLLGDLKNFTMKGLLTNATFNYDLEPEGGCTRHVSDWRCEDKISDCDYYGQTFCGLPEYTKFSEVYCPRYCGTCTPDGFGKRFIGIIPTGGYNSANTAIFLPCQIFITLANTSNQVQPNVAITSNISPLYRTNDPFTKGTLGFFCQPPLDDTQQHLIWIVSDTDVKVTVSWESIYPEQGLLYNVNPTDTYGQEYMTIGYSNGSFCDVLTEREHVSVLSFLPRDIHVEDHHGNVFEKSDIFMVTFEEPVKLDITILNENSGGIFLKSDAQIAVFCGDVYTQFYYIQLLPSRILSTSYRIPNFDLSRTYNLGSVNVAVQALQPDTIVEFISDFGGTKVLETEGDRAVVAIDPNSTHQLISNNPIAVAMSLELYHLPRTSFILIPPVSCFDANADMFFGSDFDKVDGYFITNSGEPYHAVIHQGNVMEVTVLGDASDKLESHFGIMIVEMLHGPAVLTTTFTFKRDEYRSEEVCEISHPSVNDSIDNDCDGLVDEDVCCDHDLDLDGDFSDDFSDIFEDYNNAPQEPECIPINKPDHQCWTLCQCPCSWVENLLKASQMSHDEFMSTQMIKAMKIQEQLTVYTKNLTKVTAQKTSAEDSRQSAANVGYVGVALFMLTVAFIVFLDITAIMRDLKIFFSNLKDGFQRLRHCVCCK